MPLAAFRTVRFATTRFAEGLYPPDVTPKPLLKFCLDGKLDYQFPLAGTLDHQFPLAGQLDYQFALDDALDYQFLLAGVLNYQFPLIGVWTCEPNMAGPTKQDLRGFRSGDAFEIPITKTGWPTDRPATKLYVTVKRSLDDADSSALFQLVVTTAATPAGQITANGSSETMTAKVVVNKTQSALLVPGKRYPWDARAIALDGSPWTLYAGVMEPIDTATDANS